MRILVVEDDNPLREAVATVLKEEAYQVDEADNGPDGLYMAQQRVHDLVVLDIMIPGMDGLTVLSELRAQGAAMPVLLLTARDAVADRVKGWIAGQTTIWSSPLRRLSCWRASVRCCVSCRRERRTANCNTGSSV